MQKLSIRKASREAIVKELMQQMEIGSIQAKQMYSKC